ncbi:MAG: arginine--tRNA ligase [bacterium]|nr:arginine--tRNA ligase [bacterium]
MTIREKIRNLLIQAIKRSGFVVDFDISLDASGQEIHGDYAANAALILAKKLNQDPLLVAEKIKTAVLKAGSGIFEKVEVAGPGFLNFFLSKDYVQKQIGEILREGNKYGSLKIGKSKKVQVEFISANPTGPLTIGNGRGGFWGDVLANTLTKAGFRVEKAYYVNDYGNQIMALGHSVLKDGEAKYKGDYIDWLNKEVKEKDPYRAGERAAKLIIKKLIEKTVAKMGIKFDEWISETWLHKTKRVDKALAILKRKKFLYEEEDALWFRSTTFGDQRDRVVVKRNEWKTYLAGDAGLHYYKFSEKKFAKVINIWGADHWGDAPGLQGVVEALGHKGKLEILFHQFITLFKGGQELRMSKRAGVYVTMDELLEMAGRDATRFFFLQKAAGTHLNFDVDQAKEQSAKNPVYYVQYAHARISSIIKKLKIQNSRLRASSAEAAAKAGQGFGGQAKSKITYQKLKLLNHQSELALIKQLIRLPEVVEDTAKDYQVQRLPQYALDLATSFHQFYRDCRVITEDKNLAKARLALILATKIVLKNTLDLMGITAPERM